MGFISRFFSLLSCICCFVFLGGTKEMRADKQIFSFTPVDLKCEYRINPLGVDVATPKLEWILAPANSYLRALSQTAYQVLAASSPHLLMEDKGDLWNSGKINSREMNSIAYSGKALKSHQAIWWKVRVWDQDSARSGWSNVNQWAMGILQPENWGGAQWIGAPAIVDSAINSTFLLRRQFSIKPGCKRAIISICGLGQYEMTVNGKPLTTSLLNPGWTQYDKTCLYDTYDITNLLNDGQNAVGLLLSNGMYRVKKGGRYAKFEHSFGRLQAIAKIQFQYDDGSTDTIVTDGKWKAGASPMVWSSIYGGEDWDARRVELNWDKAGFNETAWLPVELMKGPGGTLKGITHSAPPIRIFTAYKPVSSKEIKPNVIIYDLGQQASFISRIATTGTAGSMLVITPGELLNPDGTLFHNNYNGRSYSKYTLAGNGIENYTSKFFTTGCRYYQVQCLPAPGSNETPKVKSIEGLVVHGDNPFTGSFACSNDLLNRVFKMIQWAEISNMKSVISDCPHRERLGWLEQDHLHGPSFRYNYDMRILVKKIIHDMNDTQQPNGLVPCIAPELTVFGSDWREAIEWGTAAVMLPWQQYEWTGDVEILRLNYTMMKNYVAFLTSRAKNGIAAEGKGDWSGRRASTHTRKDLIATAFYYCNAVTLAKSAMLLGKLEEAATQEKLAQLIREAFNKKFFNPTTMQYDMGSQCANAMALVMGLVDPANRKVVLNNLVGDIEKRKYENTLGEIGIRYVLEALSGGERSDVIYKMNNQDEQPGYGYQLKMGATALPETWDAYRDNSQNQFMLGHIIQWVYHDLAGIQMDPYNPGFKNFIIRPQIVGGLTEVKGSYLSVQGKIVSEWKRNGNMVTMHVVVPANTTASIYIPSNNISKVTESGKPVAKIKGGKLIGADGSYTVVKVGSGNYTFTSVI